MQLQEVPSPTTSPQPNARRWALLAMLFAASVINYIDRQTLSILAADIQLDLDIDDRGYAVIVQTFLLGYTVAFLVIGRVCDRLGTKLGYALFVTWWSVANILTGFAHTLSQMSAARFALGLGEAGHIAAAPKAVGEYFPAEERALAIGVYTAGAMVGAVVAPPVVASIALTLGWRAAFLVGGVLGIIWVLVWLRLYPRQPPAAPASSVPVTIPWRTILQDPAFWMLLLSRALTDSVWYFYLFWFPKYLSVAHGQSLAALATTIWVVYLAADLGGIGGGLASGALLKRGVSVVKSRLTVMAPAAALASVGVFIPSTDSVSTVIVVAAAVAFAHLWWIVNVGAIIIDRYPSNIQATVAGLVAFGGGLGGFISAGVIGSLFTSGAFATVFAGLAILHPISWALVAGGMYLGRTSSFAAASGRRQLVTLERT